MMSPMPVYSWRFHCEDDDCRTIVVSCFVLCFRMFFVLATVSWLVKILRFAISYFVFHDTVCDWSKPLILKQLHLSFFLANHIKTNLCCHANLCRKNMFDYRRHLQMQESDCVVTYIFPSTSTLLNPMRPSSQSFAGRVALFDNPSFLLLFQFFLTFELSFLG